MNSNTDATAFTVNYTDYTRRFTKEYIAQMRRASPLVGWLAVIYAIVTIALFLVKLTANLPDGISEAIIIADLVALAMTITQVWFYARRDDDLERCIKAGRAWKHALERTSPLIEIDMPVPPHRGERIIYRERSVRYEERHVGSISQPQGAIARGILGDVVFGPAGAFIGAASARTLTTHQYNVVPVDSGEFVVSNQRVLFLGQRNTMELEASRILRWSPVPHTDRITVDYAARMPGESYTVAPLLFPMAMIRRGNNTAFKMPEPPPPLPIDVDNETLAKIEGFKLESRPETVGALEDGPIKCKNCKGYTPAGRSQCAYCGNSI